MCFIDVVCGDSGVYPVKEWQDPRQHLRNSRLHVIRTGVSVSRIEVFTTAVSALTSQIAQFSFSWTSTCLLVYGVQ